MLTTGNALFVTSGVFLVCMVLLNAIVPKPGLGNWWYVLGIVIACGQIFLGLRDDGRK